MNRAHRCLLLLIGLLAAAGVPASTQSERAAAVPSILMSRQLAENRGLRVGDMVQLSPDRSRANARPFRIAAIYEPTPDPLRFAQQRHEVRLHLPDLLGLTADPSDPSTSDAVTAINVALETPSDAAAFARDAMSRLPTIVARPTSAADDRTKPGASGGVLACIRSFARTVAVPVLGIVGDQADVCVRNSETFKARDRVGCVTVIVEQASNRSHVDFS